MIHVIVPSCYCLTLFPYIAFNIKVNAINKRISSHCPFPALMTHLPDIAFNNKDATGHIAEETIHLINEAAKGTIIDPRNLPFYFFNSCLTVSVAPSFNKHKNSIHIFI